MKVKDLMTKEGLLTVREEDDLSLAGQMMLWSGVRHLPVVRSGRLVGVLSERDILSHRSTVAGGSRGKVSEAMKRNVEVARPDDDVADAAATMTVKKVGCLPVVDEGQVVGILTTTDLLAREVSVEIQVDFSKGRPIGEIMTRDPVTVAADTSLTDATHLMVQRNVRHLPVVSGDRTVIGILSERDVRSAVGNPARFLEGDPERAKLRTLRVADLMTRAVLTIGPMTPLGQVAQYFIDQRIGAIPVVDDRDVLVGIVSYVDVIRALKN